MTTIAFLGTGTMGLPMARNLAADGFTIRAWNRTSERARPLEDDGAQVLEQPAEAAEGADLLISMLSDGDAVLDAVPDALGSLADGGAWIQMSTIGIEAAERCAKAAADAGVELVDAPVLGTRQPAEQRKLVVLASGPESARERCDPVFDSVGQRTMWLGEAGAGTRLKVVINNWIVGVVAVLGETVGLARGLDVDPRHFFEAVQGGPLDLPYAQMKGKAMIEGSYDPSFRLSLARKDAELALRAGEEAGLELRVLNGVLDSLRRAEDGGHGDEDMAAVNLAVSNGGR